MEGTTSKARDNETMELAERFANSGDYPDWLGIEWKLRELGYKRARSLLDGRTTRDHLYQCCKAARARQNDATSTEDLP